MPLEQTDPYLVIANAWTGRLQFYQETQDGTERLVGAIPYTQDQKVILAFCERLRKEVR